MELSNLEKLAVYTGGRIEWTTEQFDNLVYLLIFEGGYYIGSTANLRRRLNQYISDLTLNKYTNAKLQDAFNDSETFVVYCLERVGKKENLTRREQFYIDILSPNLNVRTAHSDTPPKKEKRKARQFLRIAEICKEKGLTQTALAEKMGISRVGLSKAINGNTTVQTLEKIADALGVEVPSCSLLRKTTRSSARTAVVSLSL